MGTLRQRGVTTSLTLTAIAKIAGMPPSSENAKGSRSLWSHQIVDDGKRLPADSDSLPAPFYRCERCPSTQETAGVSDISLGESRPNARSSRCHRTTLKPRRFPFAKRRRAQTISIRSTSSSTGHHRRRPHHPNPPQRRLVVRPQRKIPTNSARMWPHTVDPGLSGGNQMMWSHH
jgi:hypothetical protein